MWPFVDPNTKKKVKFEEDLGSNKDGQVGPGSLLKEVGGSMEVCYPSHQLQREVLAPFRQVEGTC